MQPAFLGGPPRRLASAKVCPLFSSSRGACIDQVLLIDARQTSACCHLDGILLCNVRSTLLILLQIDEGCVRLGAASALLKMARSQDSPVTADVYLQMALTMQVSNAHLLPHKCARLISVQH